MLFSVVVVAVVDPDVVVVVVKAAGDVEICTRGKNGRFIHEKVKKKRLNLL